MPQVINLCGKTLRIWKTLDLLENPVIIGVAFFFELSSEELFFFLQHHKDSILICLFHRIQKYGIHLKHPIRQHFWSHAIFRTPGHESITV